MNGGIAYHLKQIMTTEQLNLTQTAKLIGISVSSLRKVLKDTPLSQPIMFKINRFIDEHRASAATPDIHPINKPSFTITQTSEHQPGQQPTEVIEPGNAAANRNQRTSQTTKRQAATEQSTSRQANAGQPRAGGAAKPAKQATTSNNRLAGASKRPIARTKPASRLSRIAKAKPVRPSRPQASKARLRLISPPASTKLSRPKPPASAAKVAANKAAKAKPLRPNLSAGAIPAAKGTNVAGATRRIANPQQTALPERRQLARVKAKA
ncbi:hypothetical protein [Lacticaseibacillus nasuensis]|uniref:hypothetical protein n=1 Tax=Lacticaseibacillus nasuensis TaxID=944671 RepID=UPI0006D0F03D|nr:hypothetical protein [Lacticaseibacillus nasuensis]